MKFYRLASPKADTAEDFAGGMDAMKPEHGVNRGAAPVCSHCGKFVGMLTWLPPYQIEIETWGKCYGDIVEMGEDTIVSARFRSAYERAGLTGLEDFESVKVVKITHRRGKPQDATPCYFKATVVRSLTTVDQEASGMVWEDNVELCPECMTGGVFKRQERLVIKAESWTGEDIFYPRGGNGPIVSERFRSMFIEHGLVGAVFIPADEDRIDYYPWETASEAN